MKKILIGITFFATPMHLFSVERNFVSNAINQKELQETIEILYIDRTQRGGQLSTRITERDWDKLAQGRSTLKEDLKKMYYDLFDFSSKNEFEREIAEKIFLKMCQKWRLPYQSFNDLIK